jgi:site-specific recombinase XerD
MQNEYSVQGDHTVMFFNDPERMLCSLQQYIITGKEFGKLLGACTPSHQDGQVVERARACNRAILWILYDTGIHCLELINLHMKDIDRENALITIKWPGATQRRIALGHNCLHHLLYYLDHHRASETEFAERGNSSEDYVFLSEMGHPITMSDISSLFAMLNKRSVIPGKCLHPSTLRDTFIIRFLELSHDAMTLQKLLGNEDRMMIAYYMHLNESSTQNTKAQHSLDEHLISSPFSPSRGNRRRTFQVKE